MNLALFDLDNTLLNGDSDFEWAQFLIDQGVLDRELFEAKNLAFYEQYKAGTLDINEFLDFQLKPLSRHARRVLDGWHEQFMQHKVRGMIVVFDNRRMAAISGLQLAQYDAEFRTNDRVAVDYVQLAKSVSGVLAISGGDNADTLRAALKTAKAHDGLSVVHVPVYCGPDELGGLGAWGEWNVGNWCEDVQKAWIKQDL